MRSVNSLLRKKGQRSVIGPTVPKRLINKFIRDTLPGAKRIFSNNNNADRPLRLRQLAEEQCLDVGV